MVQIDYTLHVQYSESIDIRHNRINKFIFIYAYYKRSIYIIKETERISDRAMLRHIKATACK